jgi:hypothetical protein
MQESKVRINGMWVSLESENLEIVILRSHSNFLV